VKIYFVFVMLYRPYDLLPKRFVRSWVRRPVDRMRFSSHLTNGLLRKVAMPDATSLADWVKRCECLLSSFVSLLDTRFIRVFVFLLPNGC
jgi:hypothetical protein